ncbi:hypothetical protein FSP39_007578 [Pinctada imbricata]|uniref:Uncharacterized protein n=1 Tax=Pinctada imbricata TaxID=66713 RepID=A0AA89C4X1_PINIB|nr:hypothetical protein FSP39_007578 [Pinctada imbricata]
MDFGGKESVFICDVDDIEKVYKMEETNPYRTPLAIVKTYCERRGEPKGLGVVNGNEWGELRRPAQYNMLRPLTVQRYFPLMSEVSEDFIKVLSAKSAIPDIRKELTKFAVENTAYLSFSRRIGCLESDDNEFLDNFSAFFEELMKSFFDPPFYKIMKTKQYRRFEEAADYMYGYVNKEVKRAHEELLKAQESGTFDPDSDPHLLHQLLSDKRITSPEKAKAIIIDLFNAGGETTASTVSFLLHHLASNKEAQEKLYQEICRELPPDGALNEASLKRMSYAKACLKESFRCVFPIPLGSERRLEEDIVLKDYLIPKATSLSLCLNTNLTKDPNIFPDPDLYIPDRWMRGSQQKVKNSFAMLPFGFGARSCLGQRFAEQEMHILMIKIIQHFMVSLPDPGKQYEIIWKPFPDTTEPISLKLTPRR